MDSNTFYKNRIILVSIIEQLLYEGGDDNFVIFGLNSDYYIQLATSKGDYEIYCEAVSDNYLETEMSLTTKQKNNLNKLSWNQPQNSEGNYYLEHKVDSELARKTLAELILNTANDVYHTKEINFDSIVLNLA